MRFKRTLVAALVSFTCLAGTGAAAAGAAVSAEQIAVTTPPAGSTAWLHDRSLGVTMPDPASASATDVAAFFSGLSAAQAQHLVETYPLVVGNLDGAPLALRYQANQIAMQAELGRLKREDPQATAQIAMLTTLTQPGHQVIAFDPRSRGLVAEVFGDLATADKVSVLVPGSDIDLAHFGKVQTEAQALRAEEQQVSPGTSTAAIAWADYVTPVGLGADAATSRLADAAAPRLTRFLAGLAVTSQPSTPPSLFCHSYGSVVCGVAAPTLHATGTATDMVVLGSPGMDIDDAGALGTGVRLWATERNATDWIGNVPYLEFAGLGHGQDPTSAGFGSHLVSSTGAAGHNGYYADGTASLRNYANIALGHYGDVTS
ncbi:alpha/beta hydrolase [Streptacidiphilus jiangxiensis]|uniref:Alpha/beta hydrolase n=1 Tax=Streptacidiphilus jiangxiensis TaxID=235985 RepID=A0A1H7W0Q7_STRJI|nr:alpha/beta hydrolase [Streptacidiphilus jiangxiensis]SEM15063.1 Alpha/beta hydrolase [Streptacidiphilus jiangxiensis]